MSAYPDQTVAERLVTYAVEVDGTLVVVENVPACVCVETGEQYFSPDTVRRLQELMWTRRRPVRTINVPVYEFG